MVAPGLDEKMVTGPGWFKTWMLCGANMELLGLVLKKAIWGEYVK
jgi:hypothetical protein